MSGFFNYVGWGVGTVATIWFLIFTGCCFSKACETERERNFKVLTLWEKVQTVYGTILLVILVAAIVLGVLALIGLIVKVAVTAVFYR